MFKTSGFKTGDFVFFKGQLHKLLKSNYSKFRLLRMSDNKEKNIFFGGQIYKFVEDARDFTIPDDLNDEIFENELLDFNYEVHVENDGIGEYEYWGHKSYDKGTDYWVGTATASLKLSKLKSNLNLRQLTYFFLTEGYESLENEVEQYIQELCEGNLAVEDSVPSFDWNGVAGALEIEFKIGGLV